MCVCVCHTQGAAYPMFPDEDEGVCTEVWDEYGVVIDRARFQVRTE